MADGIRIEGLDELMRKLGPDLIARPMSDFFKRSAIAVTNRARKKAPVDRGTLRSSLTYEIDGSSPPLWAKVGSKLHYAPFQEYGTGSLAEGEGGGGGRHWPPGEALESWAARHGQAGYGFAVAQAIGKRGGLKPKRFLRGALEESLSDIRAFLNKMGDDIQKKWSA